MSLHGKNDVTGADLVTKAATNEYREGHERVFGNKLPWYKRRDLEKARENMPPNSPIVADGYAQREALGLHTESVLDHLAHRDAEKPLETRQQIHDEIAKQAGTDFYSGPLHGREMSDREWSRLPANLREGCVTHVDGVGDI